LGTHRGADEKVGLIYSGKAGFLDLGHIRDMCDVTKFVLDQISVSGGAATTVATAHGEANLIAKVPKSEWLQVAMDIANDDGFGYEIFTYGVSGAGAHNSAFSPEDLCSNWLGTRLAARAIFAGGNFDAAVTAELSKLVKELGGQTVAESGKAFDRINRCWVDFTGLTSLLSDAYLKRRNFTALPWQAGHLSDQPKPTWLTGARGASATWYSYVHTVSRNIFDFDFPREVAAIRTDATTRYGANFDRPKPCP
jgi:hypothetical protein